MVQIIEENRRTKGLAGGLAGLLKEGVNAYTQMKQESEQKSRQKKSYIDLLGEEEGQAISDLAPEQQKQYLEYKYKTNLASQKNGQDLSEGVENFNSIKEAFGEKFAKVWKASEPGARTELVSNALDYMQRGEDVGELFKDVQTPQVQAIPEIPEKVPQIKDGKISSDFKYPKFTKRPIGYTPKEWGNEKSKWRSENAPLFAENRKQLASSKKDILSTKNLSRLNEKGIAEGFEASLVNPETGDFYGAAQAAGFVSPEAQEWVKEIARFQNRAKEAFGSRVTNFDLQSYMKQFPGLLNTYEGRKRILRMMDINYKLDELYSGTLDQIYKKYGLDGIPQEKAEELAQQMIKDDTERLHNEYLGLDVKNQGQSSGKKITVVDPEGNEWEGDVSELDGLPEGYRIKE